MSHKHSRMKHHKETQASSSNPFFQPVPVPSSLFPSPSPAPIPFAAPSQPDSFHCPLSLCAAERGTYIPSTSASHSSLSNRDFAYPKGNGPKVYFHYKSNLLAFLAAVVAVVPA